MRESRTYGFVRGAHSDMRPYRDHRTIRDGSVVHRGAIARRAPQKLAKTRELYFNPRRET
jgi:hypothetical protein